MSTTEIVTLAAMLLLSGGLCQLARASGSSAPTGARGASTCSRSRLSAAVGLATAWLAGDVLGLVGSWGELTAAQVLAFLGGVYAAASGFYALWFKPRAAAGG